MYYWATRYWSTSYQAPGYWSIKPPDPPTAVGEVNSRYWQGDYWNGTYWIRRYWPGEPVVELPVGLIPHDPPWARSWKPIQRRKLLIVSNSTVGWDYSVCSQYAKIHRIPVTQILRVPLGSSPVFTPADLWTELLTPLINMAVENRCEGIIMGPAVPDLVAIGQAVAAMHQLLSGVWTLYSKRSEGIVVYAQGGNVAYDTETTRGEYKLLVGDTAADRLGTVKTVTADVAIPGPAQQHVLTLPEVEATDQLSYQAPSLPVGMLGWPQIPPIRALALVRQSRTTLYNRDDDFARSAPIFAHLAPRTGLDRTQEAHFAALMPPWGLNMRYTYHGVSGEPVSSEEDTALPEAGQWATESQWADGSIRDEEYFIELGGLGNPAYATDPNFQAAVKPTKYGAATLIPELASTRLDGGALGALWPLLANPDGDAQLPAVWYALLGGMTLMEALYYAGKGGLARSLLVTGDPLFAPFAGPLRYYRELVLAANPVSNTFRTGGRYAS